MKVYKSLSVVLMLIVLLGVACTAPAAQPGAPTPPAPTSAAVATQPTSAPAPQAAATEPAASGKKLRLGLVMHFQSPFNDQIATGAKDAAKDFGVDLDVVAPPAFDAQTAIGMFEALLQKKDDGIAVIAYPSDVWVAPINKAIDAGVPIVTTNVSAPESKAPLWVGQDEFNSGRLLAQEILKDLNGKTGKIVLGTCAPGLNVIDARANGFKDVMKDHPDIKVLGPFDVGGEPSANYAAWQNQLSANPDAVAMVGLCANDLPNLAKLSQKTGAKFVGGGYDLQPDALTGIKNGVVNAVIGQNPYLQGYLPIMALAKKLQNNVDLPKGWINSGTEVVNASNIDEKMAREASPQATSDYYHKIINEQFKDLNSAVKPMPSN